MDIVAGMTPRPRSPHKTRCSICQHKDRARIEALCVGGVSQGAVAKQFVVDRSQLCRHLKQHVSDEDKTILLAGTAEIEKLRSIAAEQGASVLQDLQLVRGMTMRQLVDAATARDAQRFALLCGKMIDVLEAVGHRTGEIARLNPALTINNHTSIAITATPEFLRLQRAMMGLVMRHPELRGEIAAMLRECEGDDAPGEPIALEAERDAA